VRARLRLPERVDDRAARLADDVVIELPRLCRSCALGVRVFFCFVVIVVFFWWFEFSESIRRVRLRTIQSITNTDKPTRTNEDDGRRCEIGMPIGGKQPQD
jgi:hypothetical protein